jgi:release factor glutamine methyltransferase
MSETEVWTVGRLLNWTADYLKEQQSESARLDAEVLLAHARNCKRIELYTDYDTECDEKVRASFRSLVKQRATGTPVAYLVGSKEFYSIDFKVTPAVLIPRPETEFIVVTLLDLVKAEYEDREQVEVLDVGTGSGCIPIASTIQNSKLNFTAIDISEQALEVAQENAVRHEVTDRVTFLQSDLLAVLPSEQKFDCIVSNPPYITSQEMEELPRTVSEYEPRIALEGGPKGSEIIEQLINESAKHLEPNGHLLIELSPQIEAQVVLYVEQHEEFESLPTIPDLAGLPRVIHARKKA